MKPVLQLIAASALVTGMMVGGIVIVSAALSPDEDPHRFTGLDIQDLWTTEPVRVDRSRQALERLPARYASHVVITETRERPASPTAKAAAVDRGSRVGAIDIIATAAIEADFMQGELALPPEHLAWCGARYRSYDPVHNTYHSLSGQVRRCTSPFEGDVMTGGTMEDAEIMTVSDDQMEQAPSLVEEERILACMERYRSYRPSDNTYQPYGGGPRQSCQLVSF